MVPDNQGQRRKRREGLPRRLPHELAAALAALAADSDVPPAPGQRSAARTQPPDPPPLPSELAVALRPRPVAPAPDDLTWPDEGVSEPATDDDVPEPDDVAEPHTDDDLPEPHADHDAPEPPPARASVLIAGSPIGGGTPAAPDTGVDGLPPRPRSRPRPRPAAAGDPASPRLRSRTSGRVTGSSSRRRLTVAPRERRNRTPRAWRGAGTHRSAGSRRLRLVLFGLIVLLVAVIIAAVVGAHSKATRPTTSSPGTSSPPPSVIAVPQSTPSPAKQHSSTSHRPVHHAPRPGTKHGSSAPTAKGTSAQKGHGTTGRGTGRSTPRRVHRHPRSRTAQPS